MDDAELKARFEKMDARSERMEANFVHLTELIVSVKESLEREMAAGFKSVNDRFDAQAKRMDKHATLWQTGRRWSSKMEIWSEKTDKTQDVILKELAELRERVQILEKKFNPPSPPTQ